MHATVSGFNPTEKIVATMHSRPVHLATATVGNNTAAAFTFKVPKGLHSGKHTVTVTGQWSGLTASVPFVIQAPKHAPKHSISAPSGTSAVCRSPQPARTRSSRWPTPVRTPRRSS